MECPAPLSVIDTWWEAPHPCPNCLFVISICDREGVVKSTDMLALGDPPFKNTSFFAAKHIQLQISVIIGYTCR